MDASHASKFGNIAWPHFRYLDLHPISLGDFVPKVPLPSRFLSNMHRSMRAQPQPSLRADEPTRRLSLPLFTRMLFVARFHPQHLVGGAIAELTTRNCGSPPPKPQLSPHKHRILFSPCHRITERAIWLDCSFRHATFGEPSAAWHVSIIGRAIHLTVSRVYVRQLMSFMLARITFFVQQV